MVMVMSVQCPANASSIELSTTSNTMWCRPVPSSVSPIYMPGRLRTASRPRSTLMESAPYSISGPILLWSLMKESVLERGYDVLADRRGDPKRCAAFSGLERENMARADGEALRPVPQRRKQHGIGAGHPALCGQPVECGEQGRAPAGVEMGRDFVEQQDGNDTTHMGDEARVNKDQADQEGLLLACRAERRRHVLGPVADRQVGPVRAERGAPRRPVAGAGLSPLRGKGLLECAGGLR